MRLILAALVLLLPAVAYARLSQGGEDGGAGEPDPGPDQLPEPSFLESIGLMITNLTRGERNNNPGNLRQSAANWLGQIIGTDSAFVTFDTPENGIRAMAKNLKGYQTRYGLQTVRAIITRYAPPIENNTAAYVRAVAAAMGVGPDQTIDLNDKPTLQKLVAAVIAHENGRNIYTADQIAAGVNLA